MPSVRRFTIRQSKRSTISFHTFLRNFQTNEFLFRNLIETDQYFNSLSTFRMSEPCFLIVHSFIFFQWTSSHFFQIFTTLQNDIEYINSTAQQCITLMRVLFSYQSDTYMYIYFLITDIVYYELRYVKARW